jgi:hypothetical protein
VQLVEVVAMIVTGWLVTGGVGLSLRV